jgi:hypothetical protein
VPSVFFYVSGHGFGHTSRQIEIINALAPRLPATGIVVRTAASRWHFERTTTSPLTFIEGPCDTGVVQIDSVRLDEEATIQAAAAFHVQLARLVAAEVEHLRRHDAKLVISDAPPLGCAAAAAYGIPSVVISNFTWDWIYQAYETWLTSAPQLIPSIQRAYGAAAEAWRLPLYGGFETFSRVVDVPFVARHATHPRDETRNRLGLPSDALLALSSFGQYGLQDFDPAHLDCTDDWQVVLTGRGPRPSIGRGVHFIDENAAYDAGVRYEDLVAAVDVIVTKPGYGIISECIANDTAMLYTARGNFVEYDVMVEQMPRFIRCEYIELEALLAGRWQESLERLHRKPPASERPETNGAEVVAGMIVEMLARR